MSEEIQRADRMVACDETIAWMTPFAPVGFNELRAVLRNRATILDLSSDEIEKLASGISSILSWYNSIGYDSFNLALYSGGRGKFGSNRSLLIKEPHVAAFQAEDVAHADPYEAVPRQTIAE